MAENVTTIDEKLTSLWHNRDIKWEDELESAAFLLQESLTLGYSMGEIAALIVQANCFTWLDQAQEAFSVLDRAEILLESETVNPWNIRLHFVYGTLYRNYGDYDKAMAHYIDAISSAKELGDTDEIARGNGNLALVYFHIQKYEKAIEGFKYFLSNKNIAHNSNDLFASYLNLSTSYYYLKQPEQAIDMALLAMQYADTDTDTDTDTDNFIVKAHGNLGSAYLIDKNFIKAKYHLEMSYKLSSRLDIPITQCVCGIDLADYYIEAGENREATSLLRTSLSIALTADFKQGEMDCYQRLFDIYNKENNYEQALHYNVALFEVNKKIFNETSDKRMKNLEVLHKVEALNNSRNILFEKNKELKNALLLLDDRTKELELANKKLKDMATTDELTGFNNRHELARIMKHENSRYKRLNLKFAGLYLDLDNFKYVNDTFGHPAGDLVLKLFALVLEKSCRDTDYLFRMGGDEFFVLMTDISTYKDSIVLADRILKNLELSDYFTNDLEKFTGKNIEYPSGKKLSVTIGISNTESKKLKTLDDLLNHSDIALLQAKSAGKGCYALFK